MVEGYIKAVLDLQSTSRLTLPVNAVRRSLTLGIDKDGQPDETDVGGGEMFGFLWLFLWLMICINCCYFFNAKHEKCLAKEKRSYYENAAYIVADGIHTR